MKPRALIVAVALCLSNSVFADDADSCSADRPALDHVIWAVPDLAAGAKEFEDLTGVTPVYGGEHTNGVTANYLAALGPCLYLEIVGPQSGLTEADLGDRAANFKEAHMAGFVFRTNLAGSLEEASANLGIRLGPQINEGGRNKPDGTALAWRTTGMRDLDFGPGTYQFVIEWLSKPHPAKTSPGGATFVSLELSGPATKWLVDPVAMHGFPIDIQESAVPDIRLVLDTPNGRVVLD